MAFPSSVPLYLDPPSWHHHHNHQPHNINQQAGITPQGGNQNPLQLPPGPTPTTTKSPQPAPTVSVQLPHHVGVGGSGSIRPNSMVDQARQARMPQPEAGLNCPRCESTNTKFCYFNNYSLTQPRHFCKTCRRYWTKGGALRNVPVGGGCRKNKKSRSKSKSKSKQPAEERSTSCSTPSAAFPEMFVNHHLMGHESSTHLLPYNIASLQNLGQQHYGNVDNVGLNIFGSAAVEAGMGGGKVGVDFEVCGDGGMSAGEWRLGGQMEQFPLMGGVGLEQPPLYPFHQSGDERNGVIGGRDLLGSKIHDDEVEVEVEGSSAVKMEGQTRQGLHVRSQILDILDNGHHGLYNDNSDNKYYLTDLTAAGGLGICSTSAGSSALFFS